MKQSGKIFTNTAVIIAISLNRAEFAVLLLNAFPYSQRKQSAIEFKDVPKTHWAYKAIGDAYEQGFFSGYPDRTFRPSQPIPRVQAIGKWIIKPELTNALSFKDGMARVNVAGYWKKVVGYDSSAIPIIEYFFEDGKWGYIRSPLSNLD